jgi:ligand-binding sensor domain-containing protein
MKSASRLYSILLLCLSYTSRAQEYSYTHYDITDGLAGSVVYCITQDKDGFLWMGTETGVSRFDGTHFKSYSVTDGLPDIEVLNMFGDSKGRVWMAPFRKSVCYYYKGKIHNQDNDSLLHLIRLRKNVENFAEDAAGNILMQERTALHLLTVDGKVRDYDSINGRPIQRCSTIAASANGHFLVQDDQAIYSFSDTGSKLYTTMQMLDASPVFAAITPSGMIWRAGLYEGGIRSFKTGKTISFTFEQEHYRHLSFGAIGDSLFYFNETRGAQEYNLYTGERKIFLPGKEVSRTFRDVTGNTWFATLGQGIFRLNSDEFKTIRMQVPGMEQSSIYFIKQLKDKLFAGDDHNYVYQFSLPDMILRKSMSFFGTNKNRILNMGYAPGGGYWLASDRGMEKGTFDFHRTIFKEVGVKSVWPKNADELFLATYWGACLFDLQTFRVKDTLWRERSTTVYCRNDTLFVGTLAGLYAIAPDHSAVFMGKNFPFLQNRISGTAQDREGTFWVATYEAGVTGYRNGQAIATFNRERGLTSDICRSLLVQNHILWIGTDKGLNRVDLDQPNYPITQYNSKDGLGSDIVNCLYSDSSVIYVGTPAGLSYFDETKVNTAEGCIFHLLSIRNAGKEWIGDSANLLIPYSDKHIRLEYAGISYRSVGSILYRYRLAGLDTGWQETKESFLDYPTLPSGKYTLQLQAINKFGNRSALFSLPFEVATPFWQTTWFFGLLMVSFLLLVWLFVTWRIRNVRRREREREALSQRLAEMENTALQAQMNPHFIFNCLNSIQQYIFSQDVVAANRYLTGFARLIRSTLHNSSKAFISLADEVDYLSTYLSLEKGRFKDKMDYNIDIDPLVLPDIMVIPPMLIQPFVENAMRHGLRHKTNGKGYIHIRLSMSGTRLRIMVEDNGIGRKQASAYKTVEHIEYQSKGMSLTADRIRMMNIKYHDSIGVEVIDLQDGQGQPAGTRVVMQFPLFHKSFKNETYDPSSPG